MNPYSQLRNQTIVDLLCPDYGPVAIETIAETLAHENRYNGNAGGYSVAQHSVHVVQLLHDQGATLGEQRGGLMHDAHEAALGDLTTPVKDAIRALGGAEALDALDLMHVREVERRFQVYVRAAAIKRADRAICLAEGDQLLGGRIGPHWPIAHPAEIAIPAWTPARARDEFLWWADRLGIR